MHVFPSSLGYRATKFRLTELLIDAPVIDVGEWQAQRSNAVANRTAELQDVVLEINLPQTKEMLAEVVQPSSLSWADEHFNERVSGIAYNPPPSHERWPYAKKSNESHTQAGKFSHTYPERFWPDRANLPAGVDQRFGVRYSYGNLNNLISLLMDRRQTRQGFLPIWFPEDLQASTMGERVPCTLGYHLMVRNDELSIRYFMRSCDFLRHFDDDVYFAGRLAQYVAERISKSVHDVTVGKLSMYISSLHIFAPADVQMLNYRLRRMRAHEGI